MSLSMLARTPRVRPRHRGTKHQAHRCHVCGVITTKYHIQTNASVLQPQPRPPSLIAHQSGEDGNLIQELHRKHFYLNSYTHTCKEVIERGLVIYDDLPQHDKCSDTVLNTMIKLCLHFKHPQCIEHFWSAIEQFISSQTIPPDNDSHNKQHRHLKLLWLFKCCVQSSDMCTARGIQVLQWMKQSHHELPSSLQQKDFSQHVIKLIGSLSNPADIAHVRDALVVANKYIYTAVIKAYLKHAQSIQALQVFNSIHVDDKDAVLLSTIMKALMQRHEHREALAVYAQSTALHDKVTHLMAIKACTHLRRFEKGQQIHALIRHELAANDVELHTALIHFYGVCGDLSTAMHILLDTADIGGVNAMLTVLLHQGRNYQTLSLYQDYSADANDVSHNMAIKACMNIGDFELGKRIYDHIATKAHAMSSFLQNTLIDFYGHFGCISEAEHLYDSVSQRSSFSVATMLKVYVNHDQSLKALDVYDANVQYHNDVCHMLALKACKLSAQFERGQRIHAAVTRDCHRHLSLELLNTLIDFYGHFGDVNTAQQIFDSVRNNAKNVCMIKTMGSLYVQHCMYKHALDLYDKFTHLYHDGGGSDDRVHIFALQACKASPDMIEKGRSICHKHQRSNDAHLNTAFVDFLGSVGDMESAKNVFKRIPTQERTAALINAMMNVLIDAHDSQRAIEVFNAHIQSRDAVTFMLAIKALSALRDIEGALRVYQSVPSHFVNIGVVNTMMDAYWNAHSFAAAVQLFRQLPDMQLTPNVASYSIALKACTSGSIFNFGDTLYLQMKTDASLQWMLRQRPIQIALISFYGKCGMLSSCEEIFDDIKTHQKQQFESEIAIWNAMINAYGRNGEMVKAKDLYVQLQQQSQMRMNQKTFLFLMHGYSHCGDVQSVLDVWHKDITDDTIKYDAFILTTVVDALARNGELQKAKEFVLNTTPECKELWVALLSGCKKHKQQDLAREIYNEVQERFRMNAEDALSMTVVMSNVFGNSEFA